MDGRDKPGHKRLKLNRPPSGMRRADREVVPVWPGEVKGVVDPSAADVGGPEILRAKITAGRLDIVDHQVKGRRGTGLQGALDLSYDNMRAAAELEDREVFGGENRSQPYRFEPLRRNRDIRRREPDMADRYRRPLIDRLGHDFPTRLNRSDGQPRPSALRGDGRSGRGSKSRGRPGGG